MALWEQLFLIQPCVSKEARLLLRDSTCQAAAQHVLKWSSSSVSVRLASRHRVTEEGVPISCAYI